MSELPESFRFCRSLGVQRTVTGGGFARHLVYEDEPTEVRTYEPKPRRRPKRLGYSLPQVDVIPTEDGKAKVGTWTLPLRAGRRELVGAVKERGEIKVRVYCHQCGEEQIVKAGTWRWSKDDGVKVCRPCSVHNAKYGVGW